MKKFMKEFKEFAMRGNVIDLAVGVIIGAAFKAIVDSLVNDMISPVLGLFLNKNFASLSFTVNGAEIKYGAFITAIINFIIMAFVIFLLVKVLNVLSRKGKKQEEAVEAVTTKKCAYCMSEIAIEATRCPHCTSKLNE
ncbi:MAG: large conductance mechanosensitive channel protein MscL [Ruminococcaceae bacterium]|nr:large conductance mechanosensitive channel protein MscL [Oscillospiraceae bacterium]